MRTLVLAGLLFVVALFSILTIIIAGPLTAAFAVPVSAALGASWARRRHTE